MSQFEDLQTIEADGIISTSELHENKTSMLYQVLPAIVQSRMPMLPSLRRSVSEYRNRGSHTKNSSSLSDISLPETPPPCYSSRPVSGRTTPRPLSVTSASVFEFDDDVSVAGSASTTTYESSSGISWQHARYGIAGIAEADRQASASNTGSDNSLRTEMIRSQYLYNLTVLLRSLPQSLTPAESMNLRAAVPETILEMEQGTQPQTIGAAVDTHDGCQEPRARTALEVATAWLVLRFFLLFQLMLPYIKHFLRLAAQFEHDHQVTRRAFNTSITVGSDVSRRVSQALCRLNEGIAGEALSNATVYCAEGIAGGIQQGLIEAKRSRQAIQRRRDAAIR
ncbi:hypothetical protein HBI56_100670 [Parastagonospora nodorum]|uniref:Uncharacterized protein n=2 Tax=Phaeosphaeria nodorum (strain SN15 / ATCC MYA-4574 / FGSC 10173) TaxID=321614 RepID=A0A7U2I0W4_PHANO|nr:hypothetical protein SNOG_06544 [Parastagonospora nodorum SN15]KAH3919163.1 hypothetical protein HBH56_029590 [Parastagonospora nodorum]EAT86375.1 hypothetical protein SNOG_06544 [Parastagonospora nodorum SN15]KAH3934371.1 hypothetical protein HBH54_052430 [Parastagonospora nodorum]KAH3943051.1 hypothetical protein HBH53_178280 [Parastagonospora nodorum]KAH3959186.1 hypothetical protein HBH51_200640 [Parastagonospora nodorum]